MQMATPCSSWITHEVSLVRSDGIAFTGSCQYKVSLTLGTLKGRAGSTLTPDPSETRQLPIVFVCLCVLESTSEHASIAYATYAVTIRPGRCVMDRILFFLFSLVRVCFLVGLAALLRHGH